jgi:phosphoribosyl 1,2-cyclic phosphodiesterase/ABC-type transporter Mla MlaB component
LRVIESRLEPERDEGMRVKFWGTRGSICTPEPDFMRYGGNTSCVEVRLDNGTLLILDAGTGIRKLGQALLKDTSFLQNPQGYVLLSHQHWDHIQGFPFFTPAFLPGNEFTFLGQFKFDGRLEEALRGQMESTYFPVRLDEMSSKLQFRELLEEETEIGGATIISRHLNHPQGVLGYRIEADGCVLAYCTDTEHYADRLDENVLELAQDADIFIYDSQYTTEEYPQKKGWGHSTWQMGCQLAQKAQVLTYCMFHHDPYHNDAFLDKVLAQARSLFPQTIAATHELELFLVPRSPFKTLASLEKKVPKKREKGLGYVIQPKDGILRVDVPASSEEFIAPSFVSEVTESILDSIDVLEMNFENLQEMDSLSLGVLASFIEKAKDLNIVVKLYHVSDFIKNVLTIARFTDAVELH